MYTNVLISKALWGCTNLVFPYIYTISVSNSVKAPNVFPTYNKILNYQHLQSICVRSIKENRIYLIAEATFRHITFIYLYLAIKGVGIVKIYVGDCYVVYKEGR